MGDELIKIDDIQNRIYTIRGMQVMLDKDLADFYSVKPRRLREQVKRNIKRFPTDFMFQLTEFEADFVVSQNATPSKQHFGGSLPYVFTEQGVAAISSVLTSEKAIEVNILIVRAFVAMRRFVLLNAQIFQRLDSVETKQLEYKIETDKKLEMVFDALESRQIQPKQGIFFDGQIFDAHKFVSDIIRSAERSIILIDNFVDESTLTLFSKKGEGVDLKIITKTVSKELELDARKFNEQFGGLKVVHYAKSHDRFLIIDDSTVYHLGASLKDLGKKWFAFSKMEIEAGFLLSKILEF